MNKRNSIEKLGIFVFIVFLLSFTARGADFEKDDQSTWRENGAYKNEVYEKIDPDDTRFDWSEADYNKVQWENVDDFSKVDVKEIPDDKWSSVQQNKITGPKVADIPPKHFDPQQVQQKNLKNLQYATVEQISAQIGKFNNLRDANHERVKEVFARDYKADVDFSGTAEARFDPATKKLSGAFGEYVPSEYPIGEYKQVITGTRVDIIRLKDGKEEKFSVDSAQQFFRREDGGVNVELGEKKAIIDGIVGTVKVGDNEVKVSGKVTRIGDAFVLESFDGKQSSFADPKANIQVETVGYPLLVHPKSSPPPSAGAEGIVRYDKDSLFAQGRVNVRKDGFTVLSKEKMAALSSDKGNILARGLVTFEDSGLKYEGLSETSDMRRDIKKNTEYLSINGATEGDVARLTRKVKVADILLDKGLISGETGISALVSRKDDKVGIVLDDKSRGLIADIAKEPTKSLLVERNLILRLGGNQNPSGHFAMGAGFGMRYEPATGEPVSILSPAKTRQYLGDDNTGIMLAQALVNSRRQFTQKGYQPGDKVLAGVGKGGDAVEATILSVNSGRIVLDVDGKKKEIVGDKAIVAGVSDEVLAQRLDVFKRRPHEAAQMLSEQEQAYKGRREGAGLSLNRFYLARDFGVPLTTPVTGVLTLETPGGTPLYYRTELIDGKEKITGWSPDQVTWMGLDKTYAVGGQFDGQTITTKNQDIIEKLALHNGNPDILRREVRENGDYKLQGASIEARQYDEWFDNFRDEYALFPDVVQQAGTQVAESYIKEGNTEAGLRYFQKVARIMEDSELGTVAQAKVDRRSSIESSTLARQTAAERMLQQAARWGVDGQKFLEELGEEGLIEKVKRQEQPGAEGGIIETGLGALSALSPMNILSDLERPREADEIKTEFRTAAEALKRHDQLINTGLAKDTKEVADIMRIALAPSAYGSEQILTFYDFVGYSGEHSLRDASDLQEGQETALLSLSKPIPNPDDKFAYTGGFPIDSYKLRKNEDRVEIQFKKMGVNDQSEWLDLETWNNDAYERFPPELIEKAEHLKAVDEFRGLGSQHARYLRDDPAIQAGVQMKSIPIGDPQRDERLLQLVEQERGRRNYAGAAQIARKISQTSSNSDIRAKADLMYNDITDAHKKWFNLADESTDRATVYQMTAELANPFAWVAFGAAGKAVGAAAGQLRGGVTVVSTAGRIIEMPAEFIAGSSGSAFRGLAGQVVKTGIEEGLEYGAGVVAGPAAEAFVMGLTGGADAIDQAQAAARNAAFKNVKVTFDSNVHVDSSGGISSVYKIADGEVDVTQLRKLGTVEIDSSGTIRFTNERTGERSIFVKEDAPPIQRERIPKDELANRWGGEELILPIGEGEFIGEPGYWTKGSNPEKTTYAEDGKPVVSTFKEGDTVRLGRTISRLDPEVAQQTVNSGRGMSSGLFDSNGNLEEAKAKFRSQRGREPTIPNILGETWQEGRQGNLGVSTGYHMDTQSRGFSESPSRIGIDYVIEVPAERIIKLKINEKGELVFPEGFDINRPDIDKFGFVNPHAYESEVTFIYEIPREYVKEVKVGALPDGTKPDIKTVERVDSFEGDFVEAAEIKRAVEAEAKLQEAKAVMGENSFELSPARVDNDNGIPHSTSLGRQSSIAEINNRIENGQVEGLENRVKAFFDDDPAKAGAFIDNEYLDYLGVGGKADFIDAVKKFDVNPELVPEFNPQEISFVRSLSEGVVPRRDIQYIKGRYGVVLREQNGFRTVIYHDGNGLRTVEVPDHDQQIIGGLSGDDNNRMRELFDAEIEAKTEVQTRTNSKGKQIEEIVRGFERKEMNDKAIKRVEPLALNTIDDVVERHMGVSGRVQSVGRNVEQVSALETVTTSSGERLAVRTFTLSDGTQHTFPISKFDKNGNPQPILFEQRLADGTTVWNSEDVRAVVQDRLPESLREANLEGRVVNIIEGSREDVAAYMKGQGVSMEEASRFIIVGQGSGGVPYDLYVGRRPDGSDMYTIGKITGESKRQRVESMLVQSGFDPQRIAVIDFKRDHTAAYKDVLEKAKPDIVIMGDKRQIESIVKSYGGSVTTVQSNLGEMKVFEVESKGEKKRVLFTDTQNGELAGRLTDAIMTQNKPIKLGVSGDSGGHAELKRMYNELNPERQVPIREIPSFEAYTPGAVRLPNGEFVQVDNKMIKSDTQRVMEEGGSQPLTIHHNTKHGNAFSSTEEDVGWILKNMDVDNTDVEMAYIAEAMDRARRSGKTPPELHALFHVEDQIAVGNPIGTRGHSFPQELKIVKDNELLRSLFGVEDLSQVTFVPATGN